MGLFKRDKNKRLSDASVILIDDDLTLGQLIARLLEEHGCTVYRATSGEEALQLLDKIFLPDAFIVDFSLPNMNGQQFVESARVRFGRTALPPVLLLTATEEGEAAANRLQIEDFLPKPFDNEVLVQHIERIIGKTHNTRHKLL